MKDTNGTTNANELVSFLCGSWENVSFEVADGKAVKREAYPETMAIKDFHTLTITAHGYRDGQDLSKDMKLELIGEELTLSQGSFRAKGRKEDNLYTLSGFLEDTEFRFRLYTMGDKFVFHRETWKAGKILQVDMSYLIRKFST